MKFRYNYLAVPLFFSFCSISSAQIIIELEREKPNHQCVIAGFTNTEATWRVEYVSAITKEVLLILEGSGLNQEPMKVVDGSAKIDTTTFFGMNTSATFNGKLVPVTRRQVGTFIYDSDGVTSLHVALTGGEDGIDGITDWQDFTSTITCRFHD